MYKHFLLLFTALTCLLNEQLVATYADYEKSLLQLFGKNAETLYSAEFIVYHVHSLSDLVDDAIKLGYLDNTSAFPLNITWAQSRSWKRAENFRCTRSCKISKHEIANRVIIRIAARHTSQKRTRQINIKQNKKFYLYLLQLEIIPEEDSLRARRHKRAECGDLAGS